MSVEDLVPSASEEEARRLRLILEATPNAMVMVGSDGRIVLVNAQAEALFGFDRSDLLTMRVEQLIPQRSRTAHLRYRGRYFADSAARPIFCGPAVIAMTLSCPRYVGMWNGSVNLPSAGTATTPDHNATGLTGWTRPASSGPPPSSSPS